jgi:aspartyl-tRNA synthetase
MIIIGRIRSFFKKIKRIIKWIPTLWNMYDFDYIYAINVFKLQLSSLADLMESDKAFAVDSKLRAGKIRTAIRLMDKVYSEEYSMEYMDEIQKIYGKSSMDFIKKDGDNDLYTLITTYEKDYSEEEIKKIEEHRRELMFKSKQKQKRAHKLLWDFIEHNIQSWWD